MDEEDLQELKDSRNVVDTTDEMDLTGGRGADFEESEKECVIIGDYPGCPTSKHSDPVLLQLLLKRLFYLLQLSLPVPVF